MAESPVQSHEAVADGGGRRRAPCRRCTYEVVARWHDNLPRQIATLAACTCTDGRRRQRRRRFRRRRLCHPKLRREPPRRRRQWLQLSVGLPNPTAEREGAAANRCGGRRLRSLRVAGEHSSEDHRSASAESTRGTISRRRALRRELRHKTACETAGAAAGAAAAVAAGAAAAAAAAAAAVRGCWPGGRGALSMPTSGAQYRAVPPFKPRRAHAVARRVVASAEAAADGARGGCASHPVPRRHAHALAAGVVARPSRRSALGNARAPVAPAAVPRRRADARSRRPVASAVRAARHFADG